MNRDELVSQKIHELKMVGAMRSGQSPDVTRILNDFADKVLALGDETFPQPSRDVASLAAQAGRSEPGMAMGTYQIAAARTLKPRAESGILSLDGGRLVDAAGSLQEEAGEVWKVLKKHIFHGHPLDLDAVKAELGDVVFYVAAIATLLGLSLDEVGRGNVRKIDTRYPGGFTTADSIARVDVAKGGAE